MNNDVFIHPSSVVDSGAIIGKDSMVWHFCHIMSKANIGVGCILGQNVFVGKGVKIGNHVKIQNNVSVYEGVQVEDDVFIGPSVVFTNVVNPRSFVERKEEFRRTLVKNGASIGANATIICGITIGSYALVGAGSVVTKDVASHALVIGNPGRQIGWVSLTGLPLDFTSGNTCFLEEEHRMYHLSNGSIIIED